MGYRILISHHRAQERMLIQAQMRQAWEQAETAWMGIVAGVPRHKGDEGYVGAIKIAKTGDISRFRVYQIQDEVDRPEEKRRTLADARRRRAQAKTKEVTRPSR